MAWTSFAEKLRERALGISTRGMVRNGRAREDPFSVVWQLVRNGRAEEQQPCSSSPFFDASVLCVSSFVQICLLSDLGGRTLCLDAIFPCNDETSGRRVRR